MFWFLPSFPGILRQQPFRSLRRFIQERSSPLYSDSILEEYEEVLCRPKFHFSVSMIHTLIGSIKTNGISVNPSPTGAELPDMDDLVFYEVVMEKQTDNAYLVTGNIRHFPKEPFIVTPNEMLDIIRHSVDPTKE